MYKRIYIIIISVKENSELYGHVKIGTSEPRIYAIGEKCVNADEMSTCPMSIESSDPISTSIIIII